MLTGLPRSALLSLQARYAKAFHQFKPDKRLRWLPQLGTVEIKLELEDRTVEVEASPLQASIVELFGQESEPHIFPSSPGRPLQGVATDSVRSDLAGTQTLAALTSKLGLDDESIVLNALNFWVQKGVLKGDRGSGTWVVLERKEEGGVVEMPMRNSQSPAPSRLLLCYRDTDLLLDWALVL